MSPDQRREHCVDEDTLAERIHTIVDTEGSRSKELIGAKLSNLVLDRVVLEAPDRFPLDLRHATVSSKFSLTESSIRLPIDLRGARIADVYWDETSFTEKCHLQDVVIEGQFDVSSTVFQKDVNFESAHFKDEVAADEARFHADTCLRDAIFETTASFDGVEFQGDANLLDDDACFEGCRFMEGATFRKAQFRYADFVTCRFEGDVDFDETTFTGDAEFRNATFGGDASFRGTMFEGDADVLIDDADFSCVTFHGGADFHRASFSVATFEDATFGGDVVFDDATFDDDARFTESSFRTDVSFKEARLRGDVTFADVVIDGDAIFAGAEFDGGDNAEDDDLTFENAEIGGFLDFKRVRSRFLNFRKLTAVDATYADAVVGGDAVFTGATFTGQLDLCECRFRGDSEFKSVTVEGGLSARGVEFQGRDNVDDDDVTFAGTSIGGATDFLAAKFRYADFSETTFSGAVTFEDTNFDGDAIFKNIEVVGSATYAEARFRDDVTFRGAAFSAPVSFDGVEFQGGANVRDDDVSFVEVTFGDDVSFEGAAFRQADFTSVDVEGTTSFHDTRFKRTTKFSGGRFADEVSFKEARFRDDVAFDGTTFQGSATFSGTEFNGGDNVEDDDVTFADASFEEQVWFDHVEFAYANFRSVQVIGSASFEMSTFFDRAVFVEAKFDEQATFSEATFEEDATFEDCVIEGDASFFGVEFEGGTSEKDDTIFTSASFGGNVDFREVECDAFGFRNVSVDRKSLFTQSEFGSFDAEGAWFGGAADFSFTKYTDRSSFASAIFEETADFDEIRFVSDVSFADTTFKSGGSFRGGEFEGGALTVDDADFEAAQFGDTADFKLAEFRYADFSGAEFDDTGIFVETTFTDDALFQRAEFDESALFSRTTFREGADFSSAEFGGKGHFDEVQFEADSTFADAMFANGATFVAAEFEGDANRHDDDASFESTIFEGIANFEDASFQYANFSKTILDRRGEFAGVTVADSAEFRPKPLDDEAAVINFSNATLASGTLGQPEEGEIFYNCTGSDIQSVTFDDEYCKRELFDYFRLCNTDFNGFDFTTHKAHLAENNWVIHEFGATEDLLDGRESAVTNPATLENTYLKAKNCASDCGERKAAAEFFIKEMLYRRRKNGDIARGRSVGSVQDVSLRTRISSVGKWLGNKILYETCGYGERLWRVLYVSFTAIFAWGLIYTFMPAGVNGEGARTLNSIAQLFTFDGIAILGRNMYFSTATFITLEYVNSSPGGSMAKWLASLEAFTGALLIALVVFVLGRRVAW